MIDTLKLAVLILVTFMLCLLVFLYGGFTDLAIVLCAIIFALAVNYCTD